MSENPNYIFVKMRYLLHFKGICNQFYQVKTKIFKNWKRRAYKEKITEDILNDLTFVEEYTDSEGSDCNQIQTSDSPQYLLDYFDKVQELGDGNCLFRALARGAFDNNERYDELHDAIWYFILAQRNAFSFFVENKDVEAYIQSMRKDGEYGVKLK